MQLATFRQCHDDSPTRRLKAMQLFVAGYYQTVPRRLADEGAQTTKVTVSNERESSYESLRLRRRSPRVHYS